MEKSTHSRSTSGALLIACIVFVVLMIIPASLGVFYDNTDDSFTAQVTTQQQTVASITTSAIKIKLDRLVGIAAAMASSSQLISFVDRNQWNSASDVTRDLQNDTSFYDTYIDRVVLFDKFGIEQSAYPTLSSGVGSSAANTGWYQALTSGAPFYLSVVTQRAAVPRINVINMAVPVSKNGVIEAFLVLQVPTANFLQFGESASLGTYGFIYITDSSGNVIIHPKFPSNNGVVNLTSIPVVRLALANKQGMSAISGYGLTKSIVSYQAVPIYNWEVITQESTSEAFATRDSILLLVFWEIVAASFISLFFACAIFFFFTQKGRSAKS